MDGYSDEQVNIWIYETRKFIEWEYNKYMDRIKYRAWPGGYTEYKDLQKLPISFINISKAFPSIVHSHIFNPSINPMTADLMADIESKWGNN